jgi:D-sedoheptulose 7-phosphate isomerase
MHTSLTSGGKILFAGNGGSAADAQHFAAELVGRYKKERKGYAALALTTDSSVITAWANDYTYDTVFSRQVEALGVQGDVFVGISTSGNSKNIIEAVAVARSKGMSVILMLGKDGGALLHSGDVTLVVPSDNTPRIQEMHVLFLHSMCEDLEQQLM